MRHLIKTVFASAVICFSCCKQASTAEEFEESINKVRTLYAKLQKELEEEKKINLSDPQYNEKTKQDKMCKAVTALVLKEYDKDVRDRIGVFTNLKSLIMPENVKPSVGYAPLSNLCCLTLLDITGHKITKKARIVELSKIKTLNHLTMIKCEISENLDADEKNALLLLSLPALTTLNIKDIVSVKENGTKEESAMKKFIQGKKEEKNKLLNVIV